MNGSRSCFEAWRGADSPATFSQANHHREDETVKQAILALDQGTTSCRSIVFDRDARILAVAQQEFEQHFPKPGWVEHDAVEIWNSQRDVMEEALRKAEIGAGELAGIGITNQRETTVVWDRKTGEPVHRAIVWQDRRTADFCESLKNDGLEEIFRRKTGLLLDPYFAGTKVRWILDHVEGARGRAERGELAFGTIDSWLVWNLTRGSCHVTDVSNASRTLLFNIGQMQWDRELLEILQIPESLLPGIERSSEVYGEVADPPGISGVPIAGMAGDQQAALFGQACHSDGMAKNTYGTGCFLLMNTGPRAVPSENNLLTTIAWQVGDAVEYALEGSVFMGGAVVQWLRDGLGLISSSEEVEALAAEVEDAGGIYLVPAFAGLGAPHWDPYARGTIVGITRGTSAGHFARAALEAIAFQSYEVLRAMERDSGISLTELRVDGGASANNLLMQFQANLLKVPVVRPIVTETTALGAAYLAGLAVGFWSDREEIATRWQEERRFEPSTDAAAGDDALDGWSRAVERAKAWAHE
jgi:glycerol kinase